MKRIDVLWSLVGEARNRCHEGLITETQALIEVATQAHNALLQQVDDLERKAHDAGVDVNDMVRCCSTCINDDPRSCNLSAYHNGVDEKCRANNFSEWSPKAITVLTVKR